MIQITEDIGRRKRGHDKYWDREAMVPDTPPRSEGNQETLAVKAKENGEVTISKKGLAQLLLSLIHI